MECRPISLKALQALCVQGCGLDRQPCADFAQDVPARTTPSHTSSSDFYGLNKQAPLQLSLRIRLCHVCVCVCLTQAS